MIHMYYLRYVDPGKKLTKKTEMNSTLKNVTGGLKEDEENKE